MQNTHDDKNQPRKFREMLKQETQKKTIAEDRLRFEDSNLNLLLLVIKGLCKAIFF